MCSLQDEVSAPCTPLSVLSSFPSPVKTNLDDFFSFFEVKSLLPSAYLLTTEHGQTGKLPCHRCTFMQFFYTGSTWWNLGGEKENSTFIAGTRKQRTGRTSKSKLLTTTVKGLCGKPGPEEWSPQRCSFPVLQRRFFSISHTERHWSPSCFSTWMPSSGYLCYNTWPALCFPATSYQ